MEKNPLFLVGKKNNCHTGVIQLILYPKIPCSFLATLLYKAILDGFANKIQDYSNRNQDFASLV